MTDLVTDARAFAHWAHGSINQTRKYSGEPYIVHPEAVAELVASVAHTPAMRAAAWLHDVVDDVAEVTHDIILRRFGDETALHVFELSDRTSLSDGNRAARKEQERFYLERSSIGTKTIKLADIICNTDDIEHQDEKFARIYLREKALSLAVLAEGNPILLARAVRNIVDGATRLKLDFSELGLRV